jgi:uncharacterized iron-regulated protein
MPALSRRRTLTLACVAAAATLAGCAASATPRPDAALADALAPADLLLLGEQHDDPQHQERHRAVVQALAAQGRLAALALEMAEQGTSTAGLPRDAGEAAVRAALRWDEAAWPWAAYGPAVMAAVAAGVPVLGANLPRGAMHAAMADAALDATLDPQALADQREAIRTGHCDLLPATQLAPMARIQLGRDRAMAATLAQAAVPGRTVVLLAGAGHVDERLGVPRHLPATLRVRAVRWPASGRAPATDHCAALRARFGRPPQGR